MHARAAGLVANALALTALLVIALGRAADVALDASRERRFIDAGVWRARALADAGRR